MRLRRLGEDALGFLVFMTVILFVLGMTMYFDNKPPQTVRGYQDELVSRQLAHWEAEPRTGITTLVIDGPCPCGPLERR